MTVFEDKRPKSFASLPHEYIIVDKKNPDPKQRVIGVNQKWTIEDALLHSTSLGGKVCCSYNLKDTNFAVFDVDTDDYPYEQFCDDLHIGIKSTYWVKGNTKGYHVWVAYGKSYKKPSNKNVVNVMKNCVGDYLGEKVFERIDKEWMNTGIQMIVDKQMMGFIFDMDKINKIKPKKQSILESKASNRDRAIVAVNYAKWAAAQAWCKRNGLTFRVVTEEDIFHQGRKRK